MQKVSLTQISSYMDSCISKTFDTIVNIFNEYNVSTYANSTVNSPDTRRNVYTTLSRSVGYILSSDSVIAVTTDPKDSVITNTGNIISSYFPTMIGISENAFFDFTNTIYSADDNALNYIVSDTKKNMLTIGSCNKTKYRNPVYVFITIPIDTLMQFSEGSDSKYAITIDNNLIYASDGLNFSEDSISELMDNRKVTQITSGTADFLGILKYHQIFPSSYYQKNLTKRLLILYLMCTLALIVGMLLIRRQTKKNYAPIKDLMSLIDSNYDPDIQDEFMFIKKHFNTLSSDNRDFSEKLEMYKKPLEESNLTKLLYNTMAPNTKKSFLEAYNLPEDRNYIAAIAEHTHTTMLNALSSDSVIVLRKTIIDMFASHFESAIFFRMFPLGNSKYVLITSVEDMTNFRNQLHKFTLSVGESMKTDLSISLGCVVSSLYDIHISFQSALNVSQNKIFGLSHSTICSAEDLQNYNNSLIYYPTETEAAIIESVSEGVFDVTVQIIENLISENFSGDTYTQEQFSQFIFMITATFNRIFSLMNKKSEDFFNDDVVIYLELKLCHTPEELTEKIVALMQIISDSVKEHRNNSEKTSGVIMTQYIENNYTKDIALIDLAEYLNFSAEHTSRLFKQITGKNFKEYLMRFRFEKAIELIKNNPNMKLKDISAAVGCTNTSMLSRIFLKYTGLTVTDYTKKIR